MLADGVDDAIRLVAVTVVIVAASIIVYYLNPFQFNVFGALDSERVLSSW